MGKIKKSTEKLKKVKKSAAELSKMSVDKFFETVVDEEDDDDELEIREKQVKLGKSKKKDKLKKSKIVVDDSEHSKVKKQKKKDKVKKSKLKENSDDENVTDDAKLHKKQLKNLQTIDPEFYKFLEQNDKKLLKFNLSDDEDDGDDDDDVEKEEEVSHKPNDDLEVPSDEEDFVAENNEASDDDEEDDDVKDGVQKSITLKLLKKWETELSGEAKKFDTLRNVVQAFNSALASIAGDNQTEGGVYRVEGAAAFNGVVQLCILHLQRYIYHLLNLDEKSKIVPTKTKHWRKVRAPLKNYFIDLTKLLENMSSGNILTILLKHLHQMTPLLPSFGGQIMKPLFRRLITLWSTGEETVRIVAFLCILRMTRSQPVQYLSIALKTMYIAYVRNSKFVSPTTLPSINFMRRSLVEMFALDLNVAYQHSFLYIRQLAIHMRNAVTLKKKESFQAIYNWQYINSLRLWADLLALTANRTQLQPLIYPLVAITTATIKLIPTAQYFPLRFHCVKILIRLSKEAGVFIPILPYIIDVLQSPILNEKKTKQTQMKPIQFTCMLRANKKELTSNVFRDELIENIYGLTLEYMACESHRISFPDMAYLCRTSIRKFLKVCKHPNYNRKMKQLCDKIDENSELVDNERSKISFGLTETQAIESWETQLRNRGTPLSVFYESWEKTNNVKLQRQAISSEDINDYKLPTINRKMFEKRKEKNDGPVDLFPDDSDDDDDGDDEANYDSDGDLIVPPQKKQKVNKSKVVKPSAVEEDEEDIDEAGDNIDIVKDLDLNDWV